MSRADKMFKKLKYEKVENEDNIIYIKQNRFFINFYKTLKVINAYDEFYEPYSIDKKDLQAINEKFKELGWLDE